MHDEKKIFGCNIAYLRKKHHLSKKALAKLLGIGVKGLSSLESGTVPPRMSTDVVFQLSDIFHIPPQALFSVQPETQPSTEEDAPTIE